MTLRRRRRHASGCFASMAKLEIKVADRGAGHREGSALPLSAFRTAPTNQFRSTRTSLAVFGVRDTASAGFRIQ